MKRLMRLAVVPLTLGLMWLAMPPASAAYATTPNPGWYPNNGRVFAMTVANNVVYLGGGFTALRNSSTGQTVQRASLAAIDATTGELLPWNPGADAVVRALAVGADGTVYAGGDFTHAAGTAVSRVAAITPGGAAVPTWNGGVDKLVRTLAVTDDGVYVGGNFNHVDGANQNALARLNPTTGARDTSFNAHVTQGKLRAMTVDGSTLYIGGSFLFVNGLSRPYAAAVDTTGAPTAWSPAAACTGCVVLSMATDSDNVFVNMGGPGGGRVTSFRKSDATRVWQRHADGDCQVVVVGGDGLVYVGGHFGPTFDNQRRHQLAVLDERTGVLQSYALPFTGNDHPGIWGISVEPGQLRIAGGFQMTGTNVRRYAVFPTI